MSQMTPKQRVLNTLNHKPVDRISCSTGYGNVVMPGIKKSGVKFATLHTDAERMAKAVAATSQIYGWDSVVLPIDMCMESEAIGNKISLYENSEDILYPTIPNKIWRTMDDVSIPDDMFERGRYPMLFEAIKKTKALVGDEYAVASWTLGPFTTAGQLLELDMLLKGVFKEKAKVDRTLDALTDMLCEEGRRLVAAGVDFMTLREPGAAADLLSPRTFKTLIQPRLIKILEAWGDVPKIMCMCGSATPILEMLRDTGANAVSIDVKTAIPEAVEKMNGQCAILGNYDGYRLACQAPVEEVREGVKKCIDEGIDGLWPGCDIWPDIKDDSFRAIMDAAIEFGGKPSRMVGRL